MLKSASALLLVLTIQFLAACSDPIEEEGDFRTYRVTVENSEHALLAVTQASMFSVVNLPLFDRFDPSEFGALSGETPCALEGRIIFRYSGFVPFLESLEDGALFEGSSGDSFNVQYDGCNDGESIIDGSVRGSIRSFEGNEYFVRLDPDAALCVGIEAQQAANGVDEEDVNCQEYSRDLSVTFDDLSVLKDSIWTTLNGGMAVEESSRDAITISSEISGEDYSVRIRQGGVIASTLQPDGSYEIAQDGGQNDSYSFSRVDLTLTRNATTGGYRIDASGRIRSSRKLTIETKSSFTSTEVLGIAEFVTSRGIRGDSATDFPTAGTLNLRGTDRTSTGYTINEGVLSVSVDFNGDGNGDGFAEVDETFEISWLDFFNNNFIFAN